MDAQDYIILIKRILLSLVLFFTTRVLFGLFNWDYFLGASFYELTKALVVGLRFDLAIVCIVNAIFIILSIIPFRNQIIEKINKFIFILFNIVFLTINIIDMKLFAFIGKKMTFDFLLMSSDISDQASQVLMNYWYMLLLIGVYLYFLIRLYPQKKESIMYVARLPRYKEAIIGLLIIVLTAIGIRGGVQLRSISVKNAFVFEKHELGNLALNSAYSLLKSIEEDGIEEKSFFATDAEAVNILKRNKSSIESQIGKKNTNVVIIILESFSQEYIDEGYAPHLLKLTEKSFYSNQNFANGRRSIEALPSILAGIPSLIGKPLYQTQYQSNKYFALPQILKNAGYSTSFFHGGKKGTMDFDSYCASIGVDKYFAKEDYPHPEHYDGNWGIFDHHYLKYFADQLDYMKKPFFSSVFTLSSHQPYAIPKNFDNILKDGDLNIHKSISYVDLALKDFFEYIKEKPWYKNTLFVITADHTQKRKTKKYKNMLGRYQVPLILFHPSEELNLYSSQLITQHADIMPTVLNFVKVENKNPLYFGRNVFNQGPGRAISFQNGQYVYYTGSEIVVLKDKEEKFYLNNPKNNEYQAAEKTPKHQELMLELKATIQYLFNGLRKDNLYQN